MLGFLLNDMDKLWGLIGVVLVMLIVFILYCIVGTRADARAKKARRKAQMRHAEEMNFNTVEEYEAYLAAEQQQAEEEARIARQQQEDEKRKRSQQRKNAEKAAKKAQAEKKKQQKKAAMTTVKNAEKNSAQEVMNMRAMAQEINMADIQRVIAEQEEKNTAQAMTAEELPVTDEGTLIAETTEKVKEQEKNEQPEKEQEAEEVLQEVPLTEDNTQKISKMLQAATAAAAATAKKASEGSLKKKLKNRFSGSVQKEDSLRANHTAAPGDHNTISLEELQKLVEDDSAYQEIENAVRENDMDAFPKATPYVQSIPKILNTKEAIAVSPEAPKVTTFYPDGKVIRDNQLMKKRTYHQGADEEENAEAVDTAAETEEKTEESKAAAEMEEEMKRPEATSGAVDTAAETEEKTEESKAAAEMKEETEQPEATSEAVDTAAETEEKTEESKAAAEMEEETKQPEATSGAVDTAAETEEKAEESKAAVEMEEETKQPEATSGAVDTAAETEEKAEESKAAVEMKEAAVKESGKKRVSAFSRMKQKISDAMGSVTGEKAAETAAAAGAAATVTAAAVGKEKTDVTAGESEQGPVAESAETVGERAVTDTDYGEILMPEMPKAFGYKMAWLAIPNSNTAEVLKGLGLKEIAPANWTKGLEQAYQTRDTLFVTPGLRGWNLAIGHALWRKVDINQPIEKNGWLQKLADSFREVFYFSTSSDLNSHGWFYIKNGLLMRAYGYSGELDEVMWNFGQQSQEEHQLIQGFAMGKTKVIPTEKDVMMLAAAWSLDTTFSRESFRPDIGFMGKL